MNEFEIIQHPQIRGLHVFFNSMEYRTPHFHAEWELLCPVENKLLLCIDAQQYVISPGELILIEPKVIHEYHCIDAPCTFLCLQVSEELFPSLRGMHTETLFPGTGLPSAVYFDIRHKLLRVIRAYIEQEQQYELYCIGMTGLILHTLMTNIPFRRMTAEEITQRERKNERLHRLLKYVDEHFSGKISLREFACREGLSLNYLSNFIHRALNQSFQEYVATVRFNYACERMVKTDDKLLTISMDSGFSDYRYFSEAFKKRTGKTPEEYRDVLRAGGHSNNLVRHSMHSREEFFTRKESIEMCQELDAQWR